MKRFRGEAALLLTTLLWGATFAIIKEALHSASPMVFLSFRFSIALLLLLPFVYRSLIKMKAPSIKDGVILGLIYFIGFASQTIGLNYTTATKSGFITGTFVVFTPFFQMLFEKKAPSKGNVIGIILVAVGLIFLSSKENSLAATFYEIGANFNIGDFFTLICAISYSVYIVYLDIVSKRNDYMPLVFMQIAVTAAGALIFAFIFGVTGLQHQHLTFTGQLIFALVYTSVIATIITTSLQTRFQKYVTPAKAGIIFSLEPIFAAIAAYYLLFERISDFGLIGCICIFSGLLISELLDKNE